MPYQLLVYVTGVLSFSTHEIRLPSDRTQNQHFPKLAWVLPGGVGGVYRGILEQKLMTGTPFSAARDMPARTVVDVNPVFVSTSMNLSRSFGDPWPWVTLGT